MASPDAHRYLHPSEKSQVRWTKETLDALEPLLSSNTRRFVLFPIKYVAIWRAYKHVVSTFWIADSIDGSKDTMEWEKICTDGDKKVVGALFLILEATDRMHEKVFYAVSTSVTSPEARCFFGFQAMIENVHREALARLASTLTLRHDTIEECSLDIASLKSVERKLNWVQAYSDDKSLLFSEKLLLFLFIQGLFSTSITAIFKWLSDRDVLLGLVYTFNRISVDRETHVNFASLLFYHLTRRPPGIYAENLMTQMVEIERSFAEELIRNLDVNIPMYSILREIECVADGLLASVGYKTIYTAVEDGKDIEKKITGGLKASYFEHEMATAYMQTVLTSPEEELSFDLEATD